MATRFANTNLFTRTNFSLGNDRKYCLSRYKADYTLDAIQKASSSSSPRSSSCARSQKQVPIGSRASEDPENTASGPVQRTNITFGNDDNAGAVTTYHDFTVQGQSGEARRMNAVPPPQQAQVLPPPSESKYLVSSRSSERDDYTYFGPHINQSAYNNRVSILQSVKSMNTRDSVGVTLVGRGHMALRRSKMDYWGGAEPPTYRKVSPAVSGDSIWKCMNPAAGSWGKDFCSEMRQNFSLPLIQKTTHFNNNHPRFHQYQAGLRDR